MSTKTNSLTESPGKPEYLTPKTKTSGIPILTPEVYRFFMAMTEPSLLDHRASHADMIRNVVLQDLQRRIDAVYNARGNWFGSLQADISR